MLGGVPLTDGAKRHLSECGRHLYRSAAREAERLAAEWRERADTETFCTIARLEGRCSHPRAVPQPVAEIRAAFQRLLEWAEAKTESDVLAELKRAGLPRTSGGASGESAEGCTGRRDCPAERDDEEAV
jgi:hypothetical protein